MLPRISPGGLWRRRHLACVANLTLATTRLEIARQTDLPACFQHNVWQLPDGIIATQMRRNHTRQCGESGRVTFMVKHHLTASPPHHHHHTTTPPHHHTTTPPQRLNTSTPQHLNPKPETLNLKPLKPKLNSRLSTFNKSSCGASPAFGRRLFHKNTDFIDCPTCQFLGSNRVWMKMSMDEIFFG